MLRGLYNRLFTLPVAGRYARPTAKQRKPSLETLEDRMAPAVLDLTSPEAFGWINGARFEQVDPQATGTGLIRSFVRIQRNPATAGSEQGYNTDFRPVEFDEKTDHTFTHSIQLKDVPVVNMGGAKYREFWLDINETKVGRLLSLDQLQVSIAGSGGLTGYSADGTYNGQASLVYNLDGAPDGDSRVELDYFLNHGSGSGDMRVLIPNEAFGKGNPYVYLYSRFGDTLSADSGFEEWWVLQDAKGRPPTFDISGMKFEDLAGDGIKDPTDPGLGGWEINLYEDKDGDGQIDSGEFLTSTTTAADGTYSFTGLEAYKQYIVAETQQVGWIQTFGGGPDGDGPYVLTLNNDLSDLDFGNFERIDISGTKYNDRLGDGITGDDSGQGGFTIELYKESNGVAGLQTGDGGDTLFATTVTAGDGTYAFADLGPGTYYVQEVVPDGWMQTFGGTYEITATSGEDDIGNDFANFELIDIGGMKFRDLDLEGDKDPGEPGVGGFTIELYKESNGVAGLQTGDGGDTLFDTAVTAADGTYAFADLGPGTYYTREVVPDGWVQTFGGTYTTVATSGADDTDNDFGNVQIGAGGAHTLGYWSNQNGQATIIAIAGGNLSLEEAWDIVNDRLADLNLRNADGSLFDVANSTYGQFRDWLLGGNAVNMAYMLSVQAAAMQLNVLAGQAGLTDPDGKAFNTGEDLVYAPGIIDGKDFITVQELLAEAALVLYGDGWSGAPADDLDLLDGHPDRAFAALLKTALDDANNNRTFVVS